MPGHRIAETKRTSQGQNITSKIQLYWLTGRNPEQVIEPGGSPS